MAFRISGLSPEPFKMLFGLPGHELALLNIERYWVDSNPGFPDRIELKEAEIGQSVLLLNHVCQPAQTPYRASHAIFISESATRAYNAVDQVPESLRIRLLSLRAYSRQGMMLDADVVEGTKIEGAIARLFANADVSYLHAHNAKQGCYSCRIDRK